MTKTPLLNSYLMLRELGLTYQEIADRYGVSKQAVWTTINVGKTKVKPKISGLVKIYISLLKRVEKSESYGFSQDYISGLKDALKMARLIDPLLGLII